MELEVFVNYVVKIFATHKFCSCGVKKEYSLFSRRNDNCKDCYNEYRKVKKSENSKKFITPVIDHIYISSKICTKCNIEKKLIYFIKKRI